MGNRWERGWFRRYLLLAVCFSYAISAEEKIERFHLKGFIVSEEGKEAFFVKKEGVDVSSLSLQDSEKERLTRFLLYWLQQEALSLRDLQKIKQGIVKFYQKVCGQNKCVVLPEQDVSDGIVQFVAKDNDQVIEIHGNEWFSEQSYQKILEGSSSSCLDDLQENLAWINRNPFQSAKAVVTPEKISVSIQDQKPVRVYTGIDNTGFQETGYQRLYTGVYLGNLFCRRHLFNYQYTTDEQFKRFQSHIANYEVPLPWRHIFSLFGGISFVRAPLERTNTVRSEGDSYQISSRYDIPFEQNSDSPQEFRFGVDFKRMNNNLVFGGNTVSQKNVNILQFAFEYKLSFSATNSTNEFAIEGVFSPGEFLPDMNKAAFGLLREGARPLYFYMRSRLKQIYTLPRKCSLLLDWACQVSSGKLLASEQFGLGGYTTIRGYQERAVNTDHAFMLRTEARSAPLSLHTAGSLHPFLFSDFGIGIDQLKLQPDFRSTQWLLSIGPGFRYHYSDRITARFDWGYQIAHIQNHPGGDHRINFGAMIAL